MEEPDKVVLLRVKHHLLNWKWSCDQVCQA